MVQQFMLKKDFFAQDLSLENPADSYFCFQLALLHSVSYFFALYQSPYLSLNTIFDSVSSNIDEVLSIDPSANVFVFEDFCRGTDRSGELCCNFSNNLTQMVNFPTHISDCDSHSSVPLDLFLLKLVFVVQCLSCHWEILIMLLSQFPLTFHQIHNRMSHFIAQLDLC